MEENVKFLFKTTELEIRWESTCISVRNQFDLPRSRLLCFIDDVNSPWFVDTCGGTEARGVHTLVRGSGTLPDYLYPHIIIGTGFFDSLIYIPGTTSREDTFVFVVTLAHELQHFVQFSEAPNARWVNSVLYDYLPKWDPGSNHETWDIPAEHDAIMVSKRVAESVLGVTAMNASVNSLAVNGPHRNEWVFFRDLGPLSPYDWLIETDRLVPRYRENLLSQKDRPPGIDFNKTNWWV